jgi:hypothetical protein
MEYVGWVYEVVEVLAVQGEEIEQGVGFRPLNS